MFGSCSVLITKLTRPLVDRAHCFGRVQDQVQNDLLQLNTISLHRSQPLRQAGLDGNSILSDCASRQHNHLVDRLIEIKTVLSRRRFLDVITHPVDDDSRAVGIADDTAERFPDLAQVWRLLIQKIEGRTSIVARSCDRLSDFVSQRGGQFSHHAHAVHMGEFRLQLAQPLMLLLGALASRHIEMCDDNLDKLAARGEHRSPD